MATGCRDVWPTCRVVCEVWFKSFSLGCRVSFLKWWRKYVFHLTGCSFTLSVTSWPNQSLYLSKTEKGSNTTLQACRELCVFQNSPGAGMIFTCSARCTFGWGSGSVENRKYRCVSTSRWKLISSFVIVQQYKMTTGRCSTHYLLQICRWFLIS